MASYFRIGPIRLFCLVATCCLSVFFIPAPGRATTPLIAETGDDFVTAPLADAVANPAPIVELVEAIRDGTYKNIHAILLIRGGRLILEEYFQGFHRNKPHQIRSATKSIGSVLVGIAIDRGYLPGVTTPIHLSFKDHTSDWNEWARAVTIQSLLTMTSGFDCDDHRGEPFQCENAMYKAGDWVDFALNLPIVHRPGEHWAYNSASLILLSEIITRSTGLSVPRFARENLFGPLGITDFQWRFSPGGRAWLGGSASMRPIDMAKFGQMCLDSGVWHNRRVVSDEWLTESTRCHAHSEYGMEYGYLWWRGRQAINDRQIEGFWAQGNGGQVIFICRELDVVAVFTGGNYNTMLEFQFMGMLINYILPAMLPPKQEKPFITPDKQMMETLPGVYRCNQFQVDLLVDKGSLSGRLAGHKNRLFFEDNDHFFMPHPIFGNMSCRIQRSNNGDPTDLIMNTAFSEIRFNKSD